MRPPDLNDLIQDLQLVKEIAIKNEQANQLVTAVLAQAKLLGLEQSKPDEIIPIKPQPLTPEVARAISNQLEDEY